MRITTKTFNFGTHTLDITLIHYTATTIELAWSIDNSYDRVELSTDEKNYVMTTMSKLVTYLSARTNLFIEVYTADDLGDMRLHIHSKWGFTQLGSGDYMVLGNEVETATAISTKLSMQVG